jgi:hypothetical protein
MRCSTTNHLTMIPEGCIALWMTLRHHLSFFPSDPAFMLVMCLECCTPTAYQLVSCLSWGKVHWIGAGRCHRDFTWDALPTVPNPLSSELRSLFVQTRKVDMFDWNPVIDMDILIEKHPR